MDFAPAAGLVLFASTDKVFTDKLGSRCIYCIYGVLLLKVVGMLRIEVCDSGKGFAAEEREKIAADLMRFNGRDLKGEGSTYTFLTLFYY